MAEYTLEQQAERAREAQGILDSDVFRDAMLGGKEVLIERWLHTTDEKVQAACWSTIHALAEIEGQLHRIISDGVVAQERIDRERRK